MENYADEASARANTHSQLGGTVATPLGAYANAIERAYDSGDYAQAAELLKDHPLFAWFGLRSDKFAEITAFLTRRPEYKIGVLEFFSTLFDFSTSGDEEAVEFEWDQDGTGLSAADAELFGRSMQLRLRGRSVEAAGLTQNLVLRKGALQPLIDMSQGWSLFVTVQHGVSEMLAGDFTAALSSFRQARMHVRVLALSFLTRDALVKAAIIEALYGSANNARALLEEAEQVPRTESWAEALNDVAAEIARAMLPGVEPEEALARLAALPQHEIGEMWPFYLTAFQRALLAANRLTEAQQQIAEFEQFPLPRVEGQGFSGSVLPISSALCSVVATDLQSARTQLQRADESFVLTRLLRAYLALISGDPKEALAQAAGLYDQTASLRWLEIYRLGLLAWSHLALGDERQCTDVLHAVLALPDGLEPHEVSQFSAEVRAFAVTSVNGWPGDDEQLEISSLEVTAVRLTEREREILREIAAGGSREEIARRAYISMNTLKAHLRSIYRKLGVRSRAGAVLEGERRGLV